MESPALVAYSLKLRFKTKASIIRCATNRFGWN
jgi:hypothetical protein